MRIFHFFERILNTRLCSTAQNDFFGRPGVIIGAQNTFVEVLPEPGVKILLIHDTNNMTYTRLKAQYYLLPHNIYNYNRVPRKQSTRKADYILVLGEIKGLQFSTETNTLNWKNTAEEKSKVIKVTLVESHPLGTLYKIGRRQD